MEMKKIESFKSEKFKENIIANLKSVSGGVETAPVDTAEPVDHIFWRFTNNREVTNYSNCNDNDPRSYTCDYSKDGHTVSVHECFE